MGNNLPKRQKYDLLLLFQPIPFSGNGIVSSLNKTAIENNLDLAILKNAVGHTILDFESLDEEMGKVKSITKSI